MDIVQVLKDAIQVVKLNRISIKKVAKERDWIGVILIIILGGFFSSYGASTIDPNVSKGDVLFSPVVGIIAAFLGTAILLLFSKIFAGKAKFRELFFATGYASILNWIGVLIIIPGIGVWINGLVAVWGLVVLVVIIQTLSKISMIKSVAVVAVLFLLLFLLMAGLLFLVGILAGPEAVNSLI